MQVRPMDMYKAILNKSKKTLETNIYSQKMYLFSHVNSFTHSEFQRHKLG